MQATVQIIGIPGLEEELKNFSSVILREELETTMKNAVLTVEKTAVQNVNQAPPEHPQVQTGRLMDSIMSEYFWTSDLLQGNIGSNVEYGPYL